MKLDDTATWIPKEQLVRPPRARQHAVSEIWSRCNNAAVHYGQLGAAVYPVEVHWIAEQAQFFQGLQTLIGDVCSWGN